MRQIKFRVWDKENKKYIENTGNPNVFPFNGKIGMTCNGSASGAVSISDWIQEAYILEQFTGLTDKNGKEIYEGDITEWFDKGSNYPEVMHIIRQVTYSVCSFKDCNSAIYPVEIIGNIHENEELIPA